MLETLLPKLLGNVLALSPRRRVTVMADEQGVLYRRGRIVRTLPAGAYWHWSFVEQIDTQSVTLDTVTTDASCIHTADGVCVAVEVAVTYRIEDLGMVYSRVQDLAVTLGDVAQACVASQVRRTELDRLLTDAAWVDARIRSGVRAAVRGWGLVVEQVRVVSLSRVRVLRVMQ